MSLSESESESENEYNPVNVLYAVTPSSEEYIPIVYNYSYDANERRSDSSESPFDFADYGMTKNKGTEGDYHDYEVDNKFSYGTYANYDTYEYFTPLDIRHKDFTTDYLGEKLGYESSESEPEPYVYTPPVYEPPVYEPPVYEPPEYPADFFDLDVADDGSFVAVKDKNGDGHDDDMFMKDMNDNRLMDHMEDKMHLGEKLINGGQHAYYLSEYPFLGIDF